MTTIENITYTCRDCGGHGCGWCYQGERLECVVQSCEYCGWYEEAKHHDDLTSHDCSDVRYHVQQRDAGFVVLDTDTGYIVLTAISEAEAIEKAMRLNEEHTQQVG